ncbi:hypothetical protein XSR1_130101 [Xenorhabdus szentirmaii DSM 16338]|uniref:Uncharacterized protein n=1 Tax=Xenorhabdus szentirmaii DSM 16338 TaxID=1427518 RepID=W1ISQ8_9GAMM|nr:hypothetical protein XSR1_130101 [Xenorhabdus szentirmaii DSM 16338]
MYRFTIGIYVVAEIHLVVSKIKPNYKSLAQIMKFLNDSF